MEISLKDYLLSFIRSWKIVALLVVLGVGLSLAYSVFFKPQDYRVDSTVSYWAEPYIELDLQGTGGGDADTAQLPDNVMSIIKDLEGKATSVFFDRLRSRATFEAIYNHDNVPLSIVAAKEIDGLSSRNLIDMVKIEVGTASYRIVVTAPDLQLGMDLVKMYNTVGTNEALKAASAEVKIMGISYQSSVDAAVLDEAEEVKNNGDSLISSILMGAIAGFVLSAGIVILMHIAGMRVRSYKDIDRALDIPLLGTVPVVTKGGRGDE